MLLYDPADGRIVHGHYVEVEVEGEDRLPDRAALERSARDAAALHAKDAVRRLLPKLAVLHTDRASFELRRPYRVDPKKRVLVDVTPG